MRHPRHFAQLTPDKPVAVEALTGRTRSYSELESRANRIARLLRNRGLGIGDTIAFLMHDRIEVFDIAWAAQRAGLHYLPVYWGLNAQDAAWMIEHADTSVLFYDQAFIEKAATIASLLPDVMLIPVDGISPVALEPLIAALTDGAIDDEARGMALQYTGGTTGQPKGVRRIIDGSPIDTPDILLPFALGPFGFSDAMRFSTTAPMYHVAPLKLNMIVHAVGGTTILLGPFDPASALAAIEHYRISHSHWVPHMFVAMTKLPDADRARYNLSSLRCAIHAAAPCPPGIKQALIKWWGPIVHEIYAGTEGVGFCMIGPEEYLRKPGSVGRSVIGKIRILRTNGELAASGEVGEIWFENALPFAYHKDAARTAQATNAAGWVTMDDLGYLDDDGYLFLRDRKTTVMQIGDITVYPRVIEDVLIDDPGVLDLGVAIVQQDGVAVLVAAYAPVVPGQGAAIVEYSLSQRAAALPASHRPATYHPMCDFPRDADGKLDRHALADTLSSITNPVASSED